jgi:CRISPR-associated protein Cmr3
MSVTTLQLTARDPIVARDGRPFGAGQGNRMRGLGWPLPSVVAGSFRTALVKAHPDLDFGGDMPQRLMAIEVAGVFPTAGPELYLPAPHDCVWDEKTDKVYRVQPVPLVEGEGVDFPLEGLTPVRLTEEQAKEDFKAKTIPPWWPVRKYEEWLTTPQVAFSPEWFDTGFLNAAKTETRDHVCLDADTGAAAEGQIFATAGLNVMHLSRYGVAESKPFQERFAEIALSARVTIAEKEFEHVNTLNAWHPLGGERRLVHWQRNDAAELWTCPDAVNSTLGTATRIRMVLATPAIFADGWKPGWLNNQLEGTPSGRTIKLKLVGVSTVRWKAVSGWSLAKVNDKGELDPRGKPGPKAIRRMVPAGSVYFFEKVEGEGRTLATNGWLRPVSDAPQDRNDGFGLAVWGTWYYPGK